MTNMANNQIMEAKETYLTLLELSRLMGTELDPECLTLCVRLCEAGVNPDALATVIRELRREVDNTSENGEDTTTNQNNC